MVAQIIKKTGENNFTQLQNTVNKVNHSLSCFYSHTRSRFYHACEFTLSSDAKCLLLAFCPKILGVGGNLRMVLCHSVVGIP